MNVTLVIPLGLFPFFAHCSLKNVYETCGHNDFDFVFLMDAEENELLDAALDKLKKSHAFRVVRYPEETNGDHMKLLDWFANTQDSHDKIVIQHADLVWTEKCDWLTQASKSLEIKPFLSFQRHCDFLLDGETISPIDDVFFGFDRNEFTKNNLSFSWGKVGELQLSKEVRDAYESNRLMLAENCSRSNRYEDTSFGDHVWLDGSEAITIESGVRFAEDVRVLPLQNHFYHIAQFFRTHYRIHPKNELTLVDQKLHEFDQKKVMKALGHYSYISSNLFEKAECYNRHFPWRAFQVICEDLDFDQQEIIDLCERIKRYRPPRSPLGERSLLPKLKFQDCEYEFATML